MHDLTCQDVAAHLDLLAAGECDGPTAQVVRQHIEYCPTCAAAFAQSQRLVGLLDLHWNEGGLNRLQQRLAAAARPAQRRRILLPFAYRAAALAALVLVTVGMSLMLSRDSTPRSGPVLDLAILADGRRGLEKKLAAPAAVRVPAGKAEPIQGAQTETAKVMLAPGKSGALFRRELLQAQQLGKLPPPTPLELTLALQNTSDRPVEAQLGDAASELVLEVQGKGVVRIAAANVPAPEFLRPQELHLASGQRYVLHLDRLISGSRNRLEYVYLTEPGEYALTARWRVTVGGVVATVTSKTLKIHVGD